eukprot:57183_1
MSTRYMQPPTQAPAFNTNNRLQSKSQSMSYNNQNGVSTESCALQLLGSNPEQTHLLQYCASEEEWNSFLNQSGLHTSSKQSTSRPMLHATAGGPNPFESTSSNNENNASQKYAIVSIMGPQSSGKSTILNQLFGTRFEVMDHTQGRRQVTTGIWIGSCPKARDLMVLDLEGTDSAERKQNRSNFERQTSLMALTLSEVLIINMWACDIGRSTGMNVDTLRAILEANLRLFAPNTKTLLLFIIREQSPDETQFGVTPAAQLKQNIQNVVLSIWNEIDKPEHFDGVQISDLFDIDFYFMPPLVYFKQVFDDKVVDLYARFTNPSHPNYYFNTSYHLSKCVPPEGLAQWTKQIFDAITSDESLNIPDQQKLLSAYRCEHAYNESCAMFKQSIQPIKDEVRESYVERFGSKLEAIIGKVIGRYKETACKYDAEEANEIYVQLVDKMETQVQFMFSLQYKHILEKVEETYLHQMNAQVPSTGDCVDDLNAIVTRMTDNARTFYGSKVDECRIQNVKEIGAAIDAEVYWKETHKRLREVTRSIRAEQWQLLCRENEYLAETHLLSKMSKLLRKPTQKIWNQISTLRIEYHAKILNQIVIKKLNHLTYDEEKNKLAEKQWEIRDSSDRLIISRCKKYCQRMDGVLQDRFDQLFNKDAVTAIPRRWDDTVNADALFETAKTECLEILKLTEEIVLQANHELELDQIKLELFAQETLNDIRTQFLRVAESDYRRAQELIRRSTMTGGAMLPTHPVTWLIFLMFAKNELWTMLTNPLYLILCVFGCAIITIGYQAHMYGFDVKTIVTGLFNKVVNVALAQLEAFQRTQIDIQQRGKQKVHRTRGRPLNEMETGNPSNPTDDTRDID